MTESRLDRRCLKGSLLCVVLGLLSAACSRGPDVGEPPRHVFLITVDTLRADHLSLYGYQRTTSPAIDRLAAGGTTFDQAVAQWPLTGASFASLFTGRYPDSTGLTHQALTPLPESYLTLAERLAARGFTTAAVVSNAVLSREIGWSQGFSEYLQTWDAAPELPEDPIEYRRLSNAARVNDLALDLLRRHRDAERLLVWVHYSDPHAPYVLPDGVENPFLGDAHYTATEEVRVAPERRHRMLIGHRRELRFYQSQYDANVRFVDRQIELLLEHARGLGLMDDALVVFTGDHGEALGEHDYYGHGHRPHNVGVRVPLVFVRPGGIAVGRRVATPVELVDMYATLEELLALPDGGPELEGDSLASLLRAGRDLVEPAAASEVAFSGAGGREGDFRSVQDREWKLTYQLPRADRPGVYSLFRLSDDPMEARDLVGEEMAQARRLHRRLAEWSAQRRASRLTAVEADGVDEAGRRALKALGYVE